MRSHWKFVCVAALIALVSHFAPAQTTLAHTAPSTSADFGCCGPVTPGGMQLSKFLDGMHVEDLWLASHKVEWRTGFPKSGSGGTHCSAFAAAVGDRLRIYMLRPPDHSQDFLASAQGHWFEGEHATHEGRHRVHTSQEAQTLANQGELVVLVYISESSKVHGHIAIVRPAQKTQSVLDVDGPETIQAGLHNFAEGNAVRSFRAHPGAWPDEVGMYAHATTFSAARSAQ
jgi:hypothetical protein